MGKVERHPPPADAAETAIWSRALSLTGALLAHLASNPQTQGLVSEMLSAGVVPHRHPARLAAPFDEPLSGLQTRELTGAEVFSEFFGGRASAPTRPT
jgi:hypothetical protein